MHDSPRIRRLQNDLIALERLKGESSVLRYRGRGNPVQHYLIEFHGKSLSRDRGKVVLRDQHEVEIKLGASYPRTMPEIRWLTPIYHPNISEIGMVCLGGYGTHWVPSLNLDELCGMLWDMARFHNYDIRSPYNREAALWVANQSTFRFPMDARPIRDLRAALGRVVDNAAPRPVAEPSPAKTRQPNETGRYHDFVRKFAASLHTGSTSISIKATEPDGDGDGLILLDLEVELEPLPAPARTGRNDEIFFLE